MHPVCDPLNNCFSHRNLFQNGVNALSKMVLKALVFVMKLKISCSLDHTILLKFHQYGETLDFQCPL